jgi:uncharacterized protein Usg
MVEKDAVSKDFRKQVLGYGLTTAEIVYRRPDRQWLLQTYVWQDYDMFPNFPALKDFLAFWEKSLEGPLFAVTVAHSNLIKPAELHAVDGRRRHHRMPVRHLPACRRAGGLAVRFGLRILLLIFLIDLLVCCGLTVGLLGRGLTHRYAVIEA